jgi:hypothetical protein
MTPAPAAGADDPGPVDVPASDGGPVRLAHGSLWRSPDGGLVLAYQMEGSDQTEHRVIPAGIVALMGTGASPLQAFKALARMR